MSLSDLNPFAGRQRVKLFDGGVTTVEFDASKDETHTGESDVTEFPVEEGSDVTDNSRPKPRTLSIHAFVTGSPISLTNLVTPPSLKASRGRDAWNQLDAWRKSGERLEVRTTLDGYKNMVITRLSIPRNSGNSDGIEFTLDMKQVVTTASKTTAKPVREQKQQSVDTGKKPTKALDPAKQEQADGLIKSFKTLVTGKIGVSAS